jgi:hypothetical protein
MSADMRAGPQDVYASAPPEAHPPLWYAEVGATILLERCPTALARVFATLCTLDLVPAAACAVAGGEGEIRLDLVFEHLSQHHLEILRRKIAQLTECLDIALASPKALVAVA